MLYILQVQYRRLAPNDCRDWVDSGEGLFDSVGEAIRAALSECGLPWRVVDEDFELNEIEYARGNEDRPPPAPPACPVCKTRYCQLSDGRWRCIDCGMVFAKDLL